MDFSKVVNGIPPYEREMYRETNIKTSRKPVT